MSELVAQDVTVHYPGQPEPSLAGVSLSIGLDDLTVALGPSGCGKTTLLNVLVKLPSAEQWAGQL
ncbi:ATP-binding cassette domain-containing protein [Paludibacterium denitrificans]|uniref:ATP-binding cassette domain-containing protein n=1 Tax=Paludibacterium denitrificans TaxID=2675226 RepID=UPI0035E42CED